MIRRDQRSEVCNEIRVVKNMDIPLVHGLPALRREGCRMAVIINMTLKEEFRVNLRAFKLLTTQTLPPLQGAGGFLS